MLYMKHRQKNTFEEKPLLQLKQNLSPFFDFYRAFFAPLFESRITVAGFSRHSLDLKLLHSASEKFNMPYE